MKASEGVRRLALLLGVIGVAAWLIVFIALGLSPRGPQEWALLVVIVVIGSGIFFLIPYLLVHRTAWGIRGFREDKKRD